MIGPTREGFCPRYHRRIGFHRGPINRLRIVELRHFRIAFIDKNIFNQRGALAPRIHRCKSGKELCGLPLLHHQFDRLFIERDEGFTA